MINDARIRYTFRMPETLYATIDAKAEKLGVSINAMILQILWNWLETNDSKQPHNGLRGETHE